MGGEGGGGVTYAWPGLENSQLWIHSIKQRAILSNEKVTGVYVGSN